MPKPKKAAEIAREVVEIQQKHAGGRPTKYDKSLCDDFIDKSKYGWSKEEICLEWEICTQTFYEWQSKHREFSEAVKKGTQLSKGWWMRQARENLSSSKEYPFNSVLWSMNMRNRFGMTEDQLPTVPEFATAKTIKQKAQALTKALLNGDIAPSQANAGLDAITKEANLIEKSDLAKRIEALEAAKNKKGAKK